MMNYKYWLFALLFFCSACNKDNLTGELDLTVKYVDSPCCGNLESLDGNLDSPYFEYDHYLLRGNNLQDFVKEQNLHLGDVLSISYRFVETGYSCTTICNLHIGLPIEILEVVKLE